MELVLERTANKGAGTFTFRYYSNLVCRPHNILALLCKYIPLVLLIPSIYFFYELHLMFSVDFYTCNLDLISISGSSTLYFGTLQL